MTSKLGRSDGNVENLLLQERVMFLTGVVSQEMSDRAVAHLLYLDRENPNADIYMYINSLGGFVTPGLAIYDAMQYVRPKVKTICIGWAMSMGAVLLSAGEKGHRYALPHASIMVHQPAGGMQGTASDMDRQFSEIQKIKSLLTGILADHTGQPIKKVAKDIDRDYYMTAEEAVRYGLIDGILRKSGDLPDLSAKIAALPFEDEEDAA